MSLRPKVRPTTTKAGIKNRFEVHKDRMQKHFDLFPGRDNPFKETHAAMSRAGGPKYTGFRDTIDGGGPGMSGAMFSSRDLRGMGYDQNDDDYISQAEFDAARERNPALFAQNMNTGIGGFSNNMLGMRPLGSYAQERGLGPAGTNIGLDRGLFGFMNKGGVSGALLNFLGKGQMNPDEEMYSSQGAVETPALAEGGLMALRYYLGGLV